MHTYRDSADLDSTIPRETEWSVGYFEPLAHGSGPTHFYVLSKCTTEKYAMRTVNYLNGGEGRMP
jgi:hypothetical protein